MRIRHRARSLLGLASAAILGVSMSAIGVGPAAATSTSTASAVVESATTAANLWYCHMPWGQDVCTTITSVPAGGTVEVIDRFSGSKFWLRNGDSVSLQRWWKDTSGKCGINGDPYVWQVDWYSGGAVHRAVIGDWYLSTGPVSNWNYFPDPDLGGHLGDGRHYLGTGSGTCDIFPG